MHLSWDGPDPKDKAVCPHPVEFYCKPSPAESLNSLESGRLLLQVDLGEGVRSVACRLVNNAKSENLDKLEEGATKIKRQTSLSTAFVQDTKQPSRWIGELSIRPVGWKAVEEPMRGLVRLAPISVVVIISIALR